MRIYRTMEISRLLGLSKMQIIHSVVLGIVKPFQDAKGRGGSRLYSQHNFKQFEIIKALLSCGIPYGNIRDIFNSRKDLDELRLEVIEFYSMYRHLIRGYNLTE